MPVNLSTFQLDTSLCRISWALSVDGAISVEGGGCDGVGWCAVYRCFSLCNYVYLGQHIQKGAA